MTRDRLWQFVFTAVKLLVIALMGCVHRVSPLTILIEGWTRVPHSFAIVNNFQIVGLLTQYSDIQIYLTETTYYYSTWAPTDLSRIIGGEYQQLIEQLPVWRGEPIDIVYRIHFPLDIREINFFPDRNVPMILFYAATRSVFSYQELIAPDEYLSHSVSALAASQDVNGDPWDRDLATTLIAQLPSTVYFVTPSPGSAHAMKMLMSDVHYNRNHRIIPHGVDLSMFYPMKDFELRAAVRRAYGVEPTDLMFLHVGAMVSAKGLDIMIVTALWLAKHVDVVGNFKLVLKGLDDIYGSKQLLQSKLDSLVESNIATTEDLQLLIENNIRFTAQTLSHYELNSLYNAADAYWSPYAYEAFNIPVLEAIATGLPMFVSQNGSTAYFIDHILEHVPAAKDFIYPIPAQSYHFHTCMYFGVYPAELFNLVIQHLPKLRLRATSNRPPSKYYLESLTNFLNEHYSWNAVALQVRAMFEDVLSTSSD